MLSVCEGVAFVSSGRLLSERGKVLLVTLSGVSISPCSVCSEAAQRSKAHQTFHGCAM